MRYNTEEFRKCAKQDFEKAWNLGAEMMEELPVSKRYPRKSPGVTPSHQRNHPAFEGDLPKDGL
jgi:O-phosphoseryl-tRNA(Cys) synthetase